MAVVRDGSLASRSGGGAHTVPHIGGDVREASAVARRSLRPPPKPNRPPPVAVPADDDPTARVWLREATATPRVDEDVSERLIPTLRPGAPDQPQLSTPIEVAAPSTPGTGSAPVHLPVPVLEAARASSTVALEMPNREAVARSVPGGLPARLGGPRAKLGGVFAAGVFVGIVAAVTVMNSRHDLPHTTERAAAPVNDTPKHATAATPHDVVSAGAAKPQHPTKTEAENSRPAMFEELGPSAALPPVSGATVPSCREMLGKRLVERHDPRAALRETRLGKRELVRGNVSEAQAAYCLAHAWDRSNIDRRVDLARLFLVRRDWEKAAEYGQSALKLDPNSRRALGIVGDAWAALHKTEEARRALLASELQTNASPRLIVRRDLALAKRVERLRDFTLAERLYRRVLLFDPGHTGAMKGIANCLRRIGDQRAAEAWTLRAERS